MTSAASALQQQAVDITIVSRARNRLGAKGHFDQGAFLPV
jgi:hypothetical protein